MSGESEFSIDLGGGLYMDSKGFLSQKNVPENKPTYSQGGGFKLPINPETLEKALKGFESAIPKKKDKDGKSNNKGVAKLIELALDPKTIEGLQALGEIAGNIAEAVPYIGAAINILSDLLGLFPKARDPLDTLMGKIDLRFDRLEKSGKFQEQIDRLILIKIYRTKIDSAFSSVKGFVDELNNEGTFINSREALEERKEKTKTIEGIDETVAMLLSGEIYEIRFNDKDYSFWPPIQDKLFTLPLGEPPRPAMTPGHAEPVSYHRLMVMSSSYAINSYLALIRAVIPEFRSTQEFQVELHKHANALEHLIGSMREEVLARTTYKADFFKISLSVDAIVGIRLVRLPEKNYEIIGSGKFAPGCTLFPVGALDLRNHDDDFFKANKGLFNFQWIPSSAILRPHIGYTVKLQEPFISAYTIVNPEECAAEANAKAEEDYATLLYSSGYLTLVHLLATLKQETTDPDRSQTVQGSNIIQHIPASDTVPVTVTTNEIRLLGSFTSPAEQQAQQNEVNISFTTQPLDRDIKLQYRVCLRTLHVVENSTYGDHYRTSYIDDPEHSGFKKLAISLMPELGKFELVSKFTRSPAEILQVNGTATMPALTFDSWLPNNVPAEIGWETYEDKEWRNLFKAVRQEEITLDYALRWEADAMKITLKNNPTDRNYVIYVVVEEKLGSGVVLHTAQRIPVSGQLTWVPKAFFDQEEAAIEESQRRMAEIDAMAKQKQPVPKDKPRPGDPLRDLKNGERPNINVRIDLRGKQR
jgi:hypothetical protein